MIPLPYKIAAILVFLIATFVGGCTVGREQVQDKWDTTNAKQAIKLSQVETAQAEISKEVVTQYVDRIQIVRQKGVEIIKEIPVYVPSDTCPLPGGFRLLHDAAATGDHPSPARIADASPVTAQTLAATLSDNYTACRQAIEQLTALQDWARQIAAENN